MNNFELRQHRRLKVRELAKSKKEFSQVLEVVGVQEFYTDAYVALYNRSPPLVYRSGWFILHGKRICRAELMQKARQLWAQLKEETDESRTAID